MESIDIYFWLSFLFSFSLGVYMIIQIIARMSARRAKQ